MRPWVHGDRMLPSPRTYAFWLALVRIYTGIFWLDHGLGKLRAHPAFGAPDGMMAQFIGGELGKTAPGPYHDFLERIVTPNLAQFAFLVQLGELTAGILLLLGLFSRAGAVVGVVLALNYFAAKGAFASVAGYAGIDILAAALTAISVVLPTGRYVGFDAITARRPAARVAQVAPAPITAPPMSPAPAPPTVVSSGSEISP